MAEKWKTIHKELCIDGETLDAYEAYVDFIHLQDEKISIRLTIKKEYELKD